MFDVYITQGDIKSMFDDGLSTVCFREVQPDAAKILANEAMGSGMTAIIVVVSPIE